MKKALIVVAVIIVIFGIYYLTSNNTGVNATVPASVAQSPATQAPTNTMPNTTTTTPAPSSVTVSISNFSFSPSKLTVKTGTSVTWINNDNVPHTITSDTGNLLNSPTLSPGQSFSFTFVDSGSTKYHCNIHPMMQGTVIVE